MRVKGILVTKILVVSQPNLTTDTLKTKVKVTVAFRWNFNGKRCRYNDQ